MDDTILPMPKLPQSDHDLLIRVDTTLTHMREDFKSLTDTTKTEVAELRAAKLERTEFDQWKKDSYNPLEVNVERVSRQTGANTRYINMAIGFVIASEFLLGLAFKLHLI